MKAFFVELTTHKIEQNRNQANYLLQWLDVQGQVKLLDLIKRIRYGWCKNTKFILRNYQGQWYEIDKVNAFKKRWL